MSESNLRFGKYLKQRRESLGMTMRSFAEQVGISPAYLSDIENGHRNPPEKKLEKFVEALRLTESDDIYEFYNLAGERRGGQHSDINDYMERVPRCRFVLRTANDQNWTDEDWQRVLVMFEGKK